MILTDKEIRQRVLDNQLIEGFKEERLQGASYDVSASNNIERFNEQAGRITLISKESVDSVCQEVEIKFGYDLQPNEYVLIKIEEKVNLPNDLIAHVRPRTTLTKLGLIVTSQHVNPTFKGHLYLGLHNVSPNTIEIVPGLVIGQLVFEQLVSIPSDGKLYENKTDAKYQNEGSFINSKIYDDFDEKFNETYQKIIDDLIGERG